MVLVKVSVSKVSTRVGRRFMVSWKPPGGKRERRYFPTRTAANTEAETIRDQQSTAGQVWLALTADQRNEVIGILRDCQKEGFTLRQAVDHYRDNRAKPRKSATLGEAYKVFIAEKEKALLSRKTLAALRSTVKRFIAGRESLPVHHVTRDDVLKWLQSDGWGPRTFNTYRRSLNTFFLWCVNVEYLDRSPSAKIDAIDERRMADLDKAPAVLTLEQAQGLLQATLRKDKGLIYYVAVCLFAGLRPEREAAKLAKADVQNGLIEVKGLHAKDRQRRHVEIHSTLAAWLKVKGGKFQPANLRRRFERVREAAGLIKIVTDREEAKDGQPWYRKKLPNGKWREIINTGWSQDCLRHTFASHYLPVFGAEKTIAQLGHGDYDMLFGHYRKLVSPGEAAAFWRLTPGTIKKS